MHPLTPGFGHKKEERKAELVRSGLKKRPFGGNYPEEANRTKSSFGDRRPGDIPAKRQDRTKGCGGEGCRPPVEVPKELDQETGVLGVRKAPPTWPFLAGQNPG